MPETPKGKILFQGRGWQLKLDPFAHPAVAQLLGNTIWGTKGGIRYRHTEGLKKVRSLKNTSYVTLWRQEEIRACVGLVQKPMQLAEQVELPAYYIRYLAVASQLQAQTRAGQSNKAINQRQGGNRLFRRKLSELFGDADYWRYADQAEVPACFYAYVVMDNERSANLVLSNGFKALRAFRTMIFSRFKPKRSPKVRKIKPTERADIEKRLGDFYQSYSYTTEDLKLQHDYYVWEEGGEIVAGVQAQAIKWKIEEIPGLAGRLAMKYLPKIAFLRRILHPQDFRFVGMDGLFYKAGAQALLPKLYAHVLADQALFVSMIWLDDQTALYRDFVKMPAAQKGLLSKVVQGNGAAHLFVRSDEDDFDSGLAERLQSMPHYIPVGDVS